MAVIWKAFRARSAGGEGVARGKIDTGAFRTLITTETACKLGFDPSAAGESSARAVGGARLIGLDFPLRLTVGKRTAVVNALVPIGYLQRDGRLKFGRFSNLIGVDFLQATGAKLDYERSHAEVFEGIDPAPPISPTERRAFRRWLRRHPLCHRRAKR